MKKVFLEISQNSQENTCARDSFLIKLQAEACNFIKKKTLAQVFSCEFCEISKNTFSYRTPPVAASIINRREAFRLPAILISDTKETISNKNEEKNLQDDKYLVLNRYPMKKHKLKVNKKT